MADMTKPGTNTGDLKHDIDLSRGIVWNSTTWTFIGLGAAALVGGYWLLTRKSQSSAMSGLRRRRRRG